MSHSKMARNRKRAAQHDEEEAANAEERDEFSALARRVEDSEVARKAAKAFEGQGPPGVGTMMAHYFMAGIGVTIAFVLVGVAFRAVGLEPDAEADAEQGVASQVQACATDAMPPPSTHTHHDSARA